MEHRLIRADLLIRDIANDETEFSGKGCARIVKHIFDAPAIDPVHAAGACYCRECKKFYPDADFCGQHQSAMKPTDFCSYGEREQNEILD